MQTKEDELRNRYLSLLSREFPTQSAVAAEIINLEAILHLPKPTEHFMADVHGEADAFRHVLRNASGSIRRRVNEIFGEKLDEATKRDLCALIYYPEQRLEMVKRNQTDTEQYYETMLSHLIAVCRSVSSKYTRSKVRKNLPKDYAYIIEELLHEQSDGDKQAYMNVIVKTIIATHRADSFLVALCRLIQRLAVDRLHLLGDIFDRGPGAHLIMDTLEEYGKWDITWGNHDVLWMGAAAGNACCVATVLRLSLRYANTRTLEDGYAINMVPLATFAMETYGEDPCELFVPKVEETGRRLSQKTLDLLARMHKAISVIQFKLEGNLYKAHPEWDMTERILLEKTDFGRGTINIDGTDYPLSDTNFPTIDAADPCRLTEEENEVVRSLCHSFRVSERLQKHVGELLSHGGMYARCNDNLLFHASIPLNEDGSLRDVNVEGETVKGRKLLQRVEQLVRAAFDEALTRKEKKVGSDYIWYLWCGKDSPLFDKSKMATFERHFIADKTTWHEEKGWYYKLRDRADICDRIMDEFGLSGNQRHIINGHVPVRAIRGESPVKADGKLMVIDGGFAKAYHDKTGIAGYTLVYHSRGFDLVQHEPFTSMEQAIRKGTDIQSTTQIVEMAGRRKRVNDTDKGKEIRQQVVDLKELLSAYRKGLIKESQEKLHAANGRN